MQLHKASLLFLLLSSTQLISSNAFSANQTINLNLPVYTGIVFATQTINGNNYDDVVINVNNSNFTDSLVGTRKKTSVNQTLNFNGGKVNGFLAGIARTALPTGIVSNTNTINISGGTILGYVAATIDDGNAPMYSGTDRRSKNVINFSGGNIQGHLIGGAGAEDNIITITGGVLGKTVGGTFVASNVMSAAGNLPNKSSNTWVYLKDMNNSNSFLSTFVETADSSGGMVLGGVIPGMSNMNFSNLNGTFLGGFKNFNNMFVDATSAVVFGGKSYYADSWNISGKLDTNGKILHAYKNDTIQLKVNADGTTSSQFITDANVNANSAGIINGIKTGRNITLNNTGTMSAEYSGDIVNIVNSGKINDATHTQTTISSIKPGVLTNNGRIGGDAGSILTLSGQMSFANEATGSIEGKVVFNDTVSSFVNKGIVGGNSTADGVFELINNSTLSSIDNYGYIIGAGSITSSTLLTLNNNADAVISGTQTLKNVNIENLSRAIVQNAKLISDTEVVNIQNKGTFRGSNAIEGVNNGTFVFDNQAQGLITGALQVVSGLETINNQGSIDSLNLTSKVDNLTIDNSGTFGGNNMFVSDKKITLNNTGASSGNVDVSAKQVDIIQNSATILTTNFNGNLASSELSFDNKLGSKIDSSLFNGFNILSITNEDDVITAPAVSLSNNGTISSEVNIKNKGYVKLTNNGNIAALIKDAYFDVVQDCLETVFELVNKNTISSNMSILNNKFILSNTGLITSTNIDSKHLTLDNSGTFRSGMGYLFGVQDYINANNSGYIYSKDKAFMFTGDKTSGTITNSGTIWSEDTTIGYADALTPCPGNCGYSGTINLYNSGKIVAVDPINLVMPNLDSHAINADNMNVFNQAGGLIGGSILVNNYTQNAGATWVTFLDKDKKEMSTISVKDKASIEQGATLYIHTNNDVKKFKDDDAFLVVKTDTTSSTMTDEEIYEEISNFTIKTDSPFANYKMIGYDRNGYIVFNSVSANTYAASADIVTANHSNIALGSHRFYELFVNKNITQVQSMSPINNPDDGNGLYFMPIGGQAVQESGDGHSGYTNTYYGGIAYFEHSFRDNIKAGLGMAYLYNDNKYKDSYDSRGNFDTYRPFIYVNYEPGNFRADLAVGYARHDVGDDRKYKFNDVIYTSKGDYEADEYSGHLNLGYKVWNQDGEVVQPMIGVYATRLNIDSYTERGIGPMNMHVNSENYNSIKSMLGVKMSKEYTHQADITYIPELHLRWYHEMADTQGRASAYFVAQEEWFNSKGVKGPKDIGDIAFRLTTKSENMVDLFSELYYQFGDNFHNLGGTVGVQYSF